MKDFWNQRYQLNSQAYGLEPNEFFKEQLDCLTPGKLLLPLEGQGRNALYAASLGWEVEAFDSSKQAKKNAMAWASQNQLNINYKITNALNFSSRVKFDVIALIFSHLPSSDRTKFHFNLMNFLRPGGLIISQNFHPRQFIQAYPSGGPKSKDMLYDLHSLRSDFHELVPILQEEKEIELNEGKYHQGRAYVTNFVAKK